MVEAFKDEPYMLMWVLGNENNFGGVHGIVGGAGNAGQHPHEYYRFINELATYIHGVDPNHPVALGNGETLFLDIVAAEAPAIDIFGANVYRGWYGFGRSFFSEIKRILDKPVVITEYGCPAYQADRSQKVAAQDQAVYHFGHWVDLTDNMAGRGVGNAIGGMAFEWLDEWWKAGQPPKYSPSVQETSSNWPGPQPGGQNYEEWYGLASQGDGSKSPFLRQLRLSYEVYRALWQKRPSAD
jgi:beta-glucuronidase